MMTTKHNHNCNCGCRDRHYRHRDPSTNKTIVISNDGKSAYEIWLKYNPELDPNINPNSPWTEEYWIENYISGTISDKNYVYSQITPASTWVINHDLNKKASVSITDSAGTVVEGMVTINNGSTVVVQFNHPFSGEAILN